MKSILSKHAGGSLCAAALVGLAFTSPVRAADVVIGVPNWPSVQATANVLKVAIEENLGLDVELQNATNPIVFEAMDSGAMHAHPEVWMPNQQNLHDTFVKDKVMRNVSKCFQFSLLLVVSLHGTHFVSQQVAVTIIYSYCCSFIYL